jgi:hypothetical protein
MAQLSKAEYNRLRTQARRNAWQLLQEMYPEDFARLHDICRADVGLEPAAVPAEAVHGTRSKYNTCTAGPDGGKCDACTVANRDYQRGYMRLYRAGIPWTDPMIEENTKKD